MPDSSRGAHLRPRPHRPDESMSLLVDIATQALDPGYATAAARRGSGEGPARPRWPVVGGVILVASLLVIVAAVQAHRGAPAAARIRANLLAQVQRNNAAVDALQRNLDAAREDTARLRDGLLESSRAGERLSARLSGTELVAGTVPVQGPGLRVTLDDDPQGRNRVLDRDLQMVVNALWGAGAEAIAIDGQRLTSESAIRQAGDAILVNFRPVLAPYDVQAVGDPVAMDAAFAASAAAARLRAYAQVYGLRFDYGRESALTLPAAPGLSLQYARPATNPGDAP